MEINWVFILIFIVATISFVIFLVWRNQKDKKALMKKLIEKEEVTLPKEPDKDIDTAD